MSRACQHKVQFALHALSCARNESLQSRSRSLVNLKRSRLPAIADHQVSV